MCCAEFISKYVLFFGNLFFVLIGIALITLGSVIITQLNELDDQTLAVLNILPISIIVLGCIIFLIAFFGCCGAIRESRCLLIMYSVCMIILAGAKIFITVIIFRGLNNLQNFVQDWLQGMFDKNPVGGPFQVVEVFFRCCGTTGVENYQNQNLMVPVTCCANPINQTCAGDTYAGCIARADSYFSTFGSSIGYVLIVVIIVELVAMIFALFLSHSATRRKQRGSHY